MPELAPFTVDVDRVPGGYVLRPVGELDYGVVDRLQNAFSIIGARSGDHVVLDLRELSLIDSSGLAAIVEFNMRARYERFDFIVVRPTPLVQRVFELTTIDRWLTMVDDHEQPEAGQIGADLDRLAERLERSEEALRSRTPVATPPADSPQP